MRILKLIKCVECHKGGDLVFCGGNDCPVAVHEKCVALPIRFDENGKFYCLFCGYKRDLHKELELREAVKLAQQALSDFINFKPGGGDGSDGGEKNGEGVSISGDDGCGNGGDDDGNGVKGKKGEESGKEKCSEGLVGGDDDVGGGEKCVQGVDGDTVVENHQNDEVVVVPRIVGEKDDGPCSRGEKMEDDGLNVNDGDGENRDKDDGPCSQGEKMEDDGVNVNDGDGKNRDKDEVDRSNEVVDSNVDDNKNDDCCGQEKMIEDTDLNVNEDDENICDENGNKTLEEEDHEQVDDIEVDKGVVEGEKLVETEVLSAREDYSAKEDEISSDSDSKLSGRRSDRRSKYEFRPRYVPTKILSPQRKISKTKSNQKKEVSQSKELRKTQKSPLKLTNLKFPSEKRKKLFWRHEEEEMLKEGVHKFSSDVNKNIPWRKILDFGRHVFDSTRTPTDLKDKWKNMRSKDF